MRRNKTFNIIEYSGSQKVILIAFVITEITFGLNFNKQLFPDALIVLIMAISAITITIAYFIFTYWIIIMWREFLFYRRVINLLKFAIFGLLTFLAVSFFVDVSF